MPIGWLLAACAEPTGTPPRDTGDAGGPGDTAHTGDTGAPCAAEEVPLDDRDGDCDGWADEYGEDWTRLVDEAELLLTGPGWGQVLDVGVAADGEVWVVAGHGRTAVNNAVGAVSPRLGGRVTVQSTRNDYDDFGGDVAIGRFASPGSVVAYGTVDGVRGGQALLFAPTPAAQTHEDWVGYTLPGDGDGIDATFVTHDLTGDGYDELLVRDTQDGALVVRVLDGAHAGVGWSAELGSVTTRDAPFVQNFGNFLGEPADLTGDGVIDLPISSEEDGGRVWIVSSDLLALHGVVQDLAVAVLSGEAADDDAGWDPAAGDADGDGYTDLLVGAALTGIDVGTSYLVRGPIVADRALADADAAFEGAWDSDRCGASQTFVPDSDGDDADEPVVACPHRAGPLPGRVHLLHGPSMAGRLDHRDALRTWVGDGRADQAGVKIDGGHDVDGDGVADLVVSVPADATQGAGAVYLLPGPIAP